MPARRTLHSLVLLVALLAPAASDASARSAASGPAGLHPFLLRVDEPRSTSFTRTPSFAWNPVRGAQRYEFQLSTSGSFRESGIVYSDTTLTTPVAAPRLTLPWINGSPHALYARVRAGLVDGSTTLWSSSYGFDMDPPAVPTPLPSYPGLLRWTPADGAVAYQVWFVDLPKMVYTVTNVLDQREFYSFHQAASWLGQVRWRIRALRHDFNTRSNALPASAYGPWSPVYTSVNPPFAVGPLKPIATVSDVVSTGAPSAPAHRLTPAFAFGGNQPAIGAATELYRVHVFTDKRCVNRVYSGSIVGGPAFAPRVSGPLSLPRTGAALAAARQSYLPDGDEGPTFSADMEKIVGNESMDDVKTTIGLPSGEKAAAPAAPAAPSAPTPPASGATATDEPKLIELIKVKGELGPPVGLWDTDWSSGGGYYWTVVPVKATVPGALSTSVSAAGAAIGSTSIPVSDSSGFASGDSITVGNVGNSETATVTSVATNTISVAAALTRNHGSGEPIVRTGGNIQYIDAEVAQDACAAGRVLRFGKESEPTLTAGGDVFASGLTPTGRLASAGDRPAFYGSPLVAWTAALGAEVYAVEWSKTRHPFKPEADPATTALGMMTVNTSTVLPLEPGTWYYRVRGYDYSLPTGAQAMSWSDPQRVIVTPPTFTVVSEDDRSTSGLRTLSARRAGFSLKLPKTFRQSTRTTASAAARFRALGRAGSTLRLLARDPVGAAVFVQTAPDRETVSPSAWVRASFASARRAGAPRCSRVSLPAGAGVRCSGANGSQASVVYLLQHGSSTYTLTFAGRPDRRAADAKQFAAAARSFRFNR